MIYGPLAPNQRIYKALYSLICRKTGIATERSTAAVTAVRLQVYDWASAGTYFTCAIRIASCLHHI